jgi:hypothetical protein
MDEITKAAVAAYAGGELYCNSIDANDEGCSSLTHAALPRQAAFACSICASRRSKQTSRYRVLRREMGLKLAIMVLMGCAFPSG